MRHVKFMRLQLWRPTNLRKAAIFAIVKVRRRKTNIILKVCDLDFPLHLLNVYALQNLNGSKLLIRLSQDLAD